MLKEKLVMTATKCDALSECAKHSRTHENGRLVNLINNSTL